MEKTLNLEKRPGPGAAREVQSQVWVQLRRLGWMVMVLVFTALLGTVGGGILFRDVHKNAETLAIVNRDVKKLVASMAQPPAVLPQLSGRTEPVTSALVTDAKEAADRPPVTPAVEAEKMNPPARIVSNPHKTPASERVPAPAVHQAKSDANSISALGAVQRVPGGQGHQPAQTKGMVPYLRKLLAGTENTGLVAVRTSERDNSSALDMLPNGVEYRAIKSGYGKPARLADKVVVSYLEITSDGAVLEETYSSGEPVTLDMKSLGAELQSALLKMPEGAEWEVYVPAVAVPADERNTRDSSSTEQRVYLIELLRVIRERESRR